MRKGYVDTPDGQVHYRTAGEGQPLVLLHQTPTSSREYELVIPILARDFRVVALDNPGYGNSERPARQFEIEDHARVLLHAISGLGIERAHFAGHHTGAVLGVEIAAHYPNRVDKMILSGFSARPDRRELVKEWIVSPAFNYHGIDAEGAFLTEKWKLYRSMCAPGADPWTWYWPLMDSLETGPGVHDGHQAAWRYDILSTLPLVKCPVLALYNTSDEHMTDLSYTRQLLPQCQVATIEGGGAFLPREMPEKFAAVVNKFLLPA